MRSLVVDDDFSNRLILQRFLAEFGEVHIAVNGLEAVAAFRAALEQKSPYHVVCLDILMPGMDGHETLNELRKLEASLSVASRHAARVAITSALDTKENVLGAFREQADAYLVKPVQKAKLHDLLREWGVVPALKATGT
jgi:two-component system chemotaxis response regulator CheY